MSRLPLGPRLRPGHSCPRGERRSLPSAEGGGSERGAQRPARLRGERASPAFFRRRRSFRSWRGWQPRGAS
eukprot:5235403-Alexandrium_andersonii.AAC.2